MTLRERNNKDFKTVKEVLERNGIKWFAIQGTALGAVRDGDFIEWDDDVDLAGFMTKAQEALIRQELRNEGFRVEDDYCIPLPQGCTKVEGYIRAIRYSLVDIYRLLEDENGYFVNNIGPLHFEDGTLDELMAVKLGGQECFVPNPPNSQLVKLYGDNWKVPKKTIPPHHYTPVL